MDWGRFALGFVGGAANYGAKQIEDRQKSEEELRKEKMLMELRVQTEKEMAVFNHDLTQHDTDSKQSGPDLATGKYIYRDSDGNVRSTRDLTDSEKTALTQDQSKGNLELDNLKSQISSRAHDDSISDQRLSLDKVQTAASVAASRASAAHSYAEIGALDGTKNSGLHGGPAVTNSLGDRAHEVLYQNKDVVDQMVKAGYPADQLAILANEAVKQAAAKGDAGLITPIFLKAVGQLRDIYKSKNRNYKMMPLDTKSQPL